MILSRYNAYHFHHFSLGRTQDRSLWFSMSEMVRIIVPIATHFEIPMRNF